MIVTRLAYKKAKKTKMIPRDTLALVKGKGVEEGIAPKSERMELTLSDESFHGLINQTNKDGFCIARFQENITVDAIDFSNLQAGDVLEGKETKIKITQMGKACFPNCPLYRGESCGLNRYAVFARVIREGKIKVGEKIKKSKKNV
ncbi:MAG TPA: hypothetical protein DHN33_02445 [Eubacteriaceae bacterium]|nr:hypothetical protein [Eubacteriaceae bacterium]